MHYSVYGDGGGRFYLVALCANNPCQYHIGIVMNGADWPTSGKDPTSLHTLARQMCVDFTPFTSRSVPEHVQEVILALEEAG